MGGGLAVAVAVGVAIIFGVKAPAGGTLDPQGIVHRAGFARKAGLDLASTAVARTYAHIRRKTTFAFFGEDLHHACHGIRAIHRRSRTAHNLDALHLPQCNGFPRCATGGLGIHPHTIDIHRGKACIGSTDKQAASRAWPAVARKLQPRLAGQQISHIHRAAALDLLLVNQGDVCQHIGQRLCHTVGCHNNRGAFFRLLLGCRLPLGNGRKQAGYGRSQRQGTQRSIHEMVKDKHGRAACKGTPDHARHAARATTRPAIRQWRGSATTRSMVRSLT